VVLPPSSYQQEAQKIETRWPAAVDYVAEQGLNEVFAGPLDDVGIIVQGGLFNALNRALELLDLSDSFGETKIPIYVLNVTYPLIPSELTSFCADKKAVLVVEEGQPNYIEQFVKSVLLDSNSRATVHGKDVLPMAGEYRTQILLDGVAKFTASTRPAGLDLDALATVRDAYQSSVKQSTEVIGFPVPGRPPGFCIGCPERPLFSAIKILQEELGQFHVCGDIGCHLFASLPPFNIGQHTMGYGLGLASASGLAPNFKGRVISLMGDGGFWHNGLTSGIANAVFNGDDGVVIVVDNGYAAATGHQAIPSTGHDSQGSPIDMSIENALRGVGVKWIRSVNSYDVDDMIVALREAVTSQSHGLKAIVAGGECQLVRQRRVRRETTTALERGERVVRTRYGVDEDVCTGDHACIRLSGCPSLTIKDNPDPLISDPVATIDNGCIGCGNCSAVAQEAGLCPSFFKAEIINNPNWFDRTMNGMRQRLIGMLQGQ
jgi:indolepyruvate ferredoxin oxidoreductase alpha subunit